MATPDRPTPYPLEELYLPRRIELIVPQKADNLPKDLKNWVAEIDFEGMRVMAVISRNIGVRILTTGGRDIYLSFPLISSGLAQAARKLSTTLIDGKIVYGEGKTRKDWYKVKGRSQSTRRRPKEDHLYLFVASDLLEVDGQSVQHLPLLQRQSQLAKVLHPSLRKKFKIEPNLFEKTPRRINLLLDAAEDQEYSGLLLREKDSPYDRSTIWLRVGVPLPKKPDPTTPLF